MSDGVRENCGNCRFFAGDEEDGGDELFSEGLCKAHPPVVIVVDPGYRSVFPMTERGGWCGEFAPSKEGEGI